MMMVHCTTPSTNIYYACICGQGRLIIYNYPPSRSPKKTQTCVRTGLCLYGNELNEETSPVEAGLTWTIGQARRAEGAAPFLGSELILAQVNDRSLVKKLRAGQCAVPNPTNTTTLFCPSCMCSRMLWGSVGRSNLPVSFS